MPNYCDSDMRAMALNPKLDPALRAELSGILISVMGECAAGSITCVRHCDDLAHELARSGLPGIGTELRVSLLESLRLYPGSNSFNPDLADEFVKIATEGAADLQLAKRIVDILMEPTPRDLDEVGPQHILKILDKRPELLPYVIEKSAKMPGRRMLYLYNAAKAVPFDQRHQVASAIADALNTAKPAPQGNDSGSTYLRINDPVPQALEYGYHLISEGLLNPNPEHDALRSISAGGLNSALFSGGVKDPESSLLDAFGAVALNKDWNTKVRRDAARRVSCIAAGAPAFSYSLQSEARSLLKQIPNSVRTPAKECD